MLSRVSGIPTTPNRYDAFRGGQQLPSQRAKASGRSPQVRGQAQQPKQEILCQVGNAVVVNECNPNGTPAGFCEATPSDVAVINYSAGVITDGGVVFAKNGASTQIRVKAAQGITQADVDTAVRGFEEYAKQNCFQFAQSVITPAPNQTLVQVSTNWGTAGVVLSAVNLLPNTPFPPPDPSSPIPAQDNSDRVGLIMGLVVLGIFVTGITVCVVGKCRNKKGSQDQGQTAFSTLTRGVARLWSHCKKSTGASVSDDAELRSLNDDEAPTGSADEPSRRSAGAFCYKVGQTVSQAFEACFSRCRKEVHHQDDSASQPLNQGGRADQNYGSSDRSGGGSSMPSSETVHRPIDPRDGSQQGGHNFDDDVLPAPHASPLASPRDGSQQGDDDVL